MSAGGAAGEPFGGPPATLPRDEADYWDRDTMADAFRIETHGEIVILVPATEMESLEWGADEQVVELIIGPLTQNRGQNVIVDLSEVEFFGSMFISLLLRTWKAIHQNGGTLVLCGLSQRAKELLSITALDTLWAIYDTRSEAIEALDE